jgi:nitrate/nitrite-specific signal transduction histidine kinase
VIRLLEQEGGTFTLEVTDDGVGIEDNARRDLGLGTRIMQYRCALLGGHLQIQKREGGGTIVACSTSRTLVPWDNGR